MEAALFILAMMVMVLKVLGGIVIPAILICCLGALLGRLIRVHNSFWLKLWFIPVLAFSAFMCCSHSLGLISDGKQIVSLTLFGSTALLWTSFLSVWFNLRLFRWIPDTVSFQALFLGSRILSRMPVSAQRKVLQIAGIRG